MDVSVALERPGYRVSRRKRTRSKVGKSHRVSPDEARDFISETYDIKMGLE